MEIRPYKRTYRVYLSLVTYWLVCFNEEVKISRSQNGGFKTCSPCLHDLQDPPPPGLLSALQLYRQKKKLKFLFGLGALKLGTRPTHPRGIGAYGSAMIVSNPQLPKCQFFTAGKTFPVRLRHSNFDKGHDAAADLRAAAIKFADAEDGGPLDVIMMTGPGTVLFDIQAVFDASSSLRAGTPEAYKEYLMKSPE